MLCCQYLWIFRLLTYGSVGGRHKQVRFFRCSAWICWENPLAIYSGSIGWILVEICHLLSAFRFHAGIGASSGFRRRKNAYPPRTPRFCEIFNNAFQTWKIDIWPNRPRRIDWRQRQVLNRSSSWWNSCAHGVFYLFLGDCGAFQPPCSHVIGAVRSPNRFEVHQGTSGATFGSTHIRFWAYLHVFHDCAYAYLCVLLWPCAADFRHVPLLLLSQAMLLLMLGGTFCDVTCSQALLWQFSGGRQCCFWGCFLG